jgi:hypothetical protein
MRVLTIFVIAMTFLAITTPGKAQIAFYDAQFYAQYVPRDIDDVLTWANEKSAAEKDAANEHINVLEERIDKLEGNKKGENDTISINEEIKQHQATIQEYKFKRYPSPLLSTEITALEQLKAFLTDPFSDTIDIAKMSPARNAILKYNASDPATNKEQPEMNGFGAGAIAALSALPGLISGNGGIAPDLQSKILDGLATYFAEEFKKGRMIAFQQGFKKTFGQIGEFQVLFPETYDHLSKSDPLKFPEMGDDLKKNIARDFLNLPDHLIEHIEKNTNDMINDSKLRVLNAANCSTIKNSKPYPYLKFGVDVSARLVNRMPLQDLFPYLDKKYHQKGNPFAENPGSGNEANVAIGDICRISNLLQGAMRYKPEENEDPGHRIWISLEDMAQIETDRKRELFVGLIYQRDRQLFDKWAKKWLKDPAATIADISKKLKEKILDRITNLQTVLSQMQEIAKASEEKSVDFVRLMDQVLTLIETVDESFELELFADKKAVKLMRIAVRITQSFVDEDFDDLTENTLEVLTVLLEAANITDDSADFVKVINGLMKYSEFMESVVNAEDNEDMAELIRKHAAEPSSFILKRNLPFTLSVTGHPGIYAGGETSRGSEKGGFTAGITAPIGIEATFGLLNKSSQTPMYENESKGSIGIYGQVFDIGAIMNFRSGDDSLNALPDTIAFKQVFSPGVSLNYGFPNSGVTLGVGYQYTPELRKINAETGNELRHSTNRFFIRMSWDLPLINIHKSDRVK